MSDDGQGLVGLNSVLFGGRFRQHCHDSGYSAVLAGMVVHGYEIASLFSQFTTPCHLQLLEIIMAYHEQLDTDDTLISCRRMFFAVVLYILFLDTSRTYVEP